MPKRMIECGKEYKKEVIVPHSLSFLLDKLDRDRVIKLEITTEYLVNHKIEKELGGKIMIFGLNLDELYHYSMLGLFKMVICKDYVKFIKKGVSDDR